MYTPLTIIGLLSSVGPRCTCANVDIFIPDENSSGGGPRDARVALRIADSVFQEQLLETSAINAKTPTMPPEHGGSYSEFGDGGPRSIAEGGSLRSLEKAPRRINGVKFFGNTLGAARGT